MLSHPSTFLRAGQIANRRATKTQPAQPGIVPVSIAHWHRLVAAGKAPQPIKLGRCTMWRLADCIAFVESFSNTAGVPA